MEWSSQCKVAELLRRASDVNLAVGSAMRLELKLGTKLEESRPASFHLRGAWPIELLGFGQGVTL